MNENIIYDDVFLQLDNTDNNKLFFYGLIIIVLLFFFKFININLNIILVVIISIIAILYYNSKNQYKMKEDKIIFDNKTKLIRPPSKKIQSYPQFVDFIFSIQEMYVYNVQAYENLIDTLDDIFQIYEETIIDNSTAGYNYNLIDNKRKEAVNSLHSIIFNLPNNKEYINKLNDAILKLNQLIYIILDELQTLNNLYIFNNGYNRNTVIINNGPKPDNFYDKEPYSFDIF